MQESIFKNAKKNASPVPEGLNMGRKNMRRKDLRAVGTLYGFDVIKLFISRRASISCT
jgi:hypothetical protein